eukprot:gene7575-8864_t
MNDLAQDTIQHHVTLNSFFISSLRANALQIITEYDIAGKIGKNLTDKRPSDELADEAGLDRDYFYRVMRALTTDGMFKEYENRVFGHSMPSMIMAGQADRDIGRMFTSNYYYKAFASLKDTVITGKSKMSTTLGSATLWDHLAMNPADEVNFKNAMVALSSTQDIPSTATVGDYSSFQTVVDVGGSHGLLINEILKNNPNIKEGINFDRPQAFEANKKEKIQYDARYREVGGSFFESVPAADCYVLKMISHDWSDDKCLEILNTIDKSITPNGKIYIHDYLVDRASKMSKWVPWLDIVMLQLFDGKERSTSDWKILADRAGYKIQDIRFNKLNE